MLSTTISEGRTVGPYSGSCLPRCCDSSNNVLWPPTFSSSSLPPLPFPLPPFLPPAAPASAETPLLQPEPAHLNRSSTLKARLSSEVTDSLFAPGGYNTPPSTSPFLPVAPYDLVAKDYHQSIAYSQANSIFVSSHTDYLSATSSVSKKTETCIGRWEHSTLEPLHIQVPPLQPVASIVKTEGISCGSTRSSSKYDDLTPQSQSYHHHLQTNGGCNNSSGGLVTTMTTSSPSTTCMPSTNDIANGCSRTIPISWSTTPSSNITPSSTSTLLGSSGGGIPSPFPENLSSQHHAAPSSAVSSTSSVTLLQIKREPCQVSEVTTSNSLGHHQHHPHHHPQQPKTSSTLTAVVKLESPSPKSTVMDNHTISTPQNSAGAIPVGIAVARQRLQEHTATVTHQPKEVNRFGIGIADIGGAASVSSQNMFFAGTNSTMIPLSSEALTMGVSNVQNAVRTPPTFWQYPTPVPVESMLPMPIPPVGFQLVRDPSTGQYLFLPATATIEPFQPTVVWPTYPQPTAALQPPHLLLPPIAQSLQPPPLAPLQLLGSDYLATASTTLHQHTQTHSTRFVALTADGKRKAGTTVPLPIPHHAVIKIEDCNGGSATSAGTTATHHHQHSTLFGDTKSGSSLHTSAATITTAVQTNNLGGNMPTQLYYHQPPAGLIQIAPPHSQPSSMQECSPIIPSLSPPPLAVSATLPATSPKVTTCLSSPISESIVPENLEASTSCVPEVQDATIQTDTPVMSEDDNTVGADECSLPSHTDEGRDGVIHSSTSLIQRPSSTSPECHNVTSNIQEDVQQEELVPNEIETDSSRNDSGFDSNAVTSTNSLEEPSVVSEQWTYSNNIEENESEEMTASNILSEKEQEYRSISKVTSTPVDLSGLELLSNISIEAIEKKITYIKQEPIEEKRSPPIICQQEQPTADKEPELTSEKYTSQHEQLGGLNLLCALAEQRIQEEVGKRHRKRSSSSTESHGSKKKKHKHSKSSKKSRSDKERKEKRRHRKSEDLDEDFKQEFVEENEGLDENLKETLNRVKAKYDKCTNCKNDDSSHCCKEKCNWPTTEELIRAMETDMMLRLADITRQCKEKKRELDEISPILQQRKNQQLSDRESTPLSSKGSVRSFQLDKLQICATKFTCESPAPSENQGIEIPKICSDTESSKFEDIETSSSSSSKRKRGNPKKQDDSNTETIVAKKPKSLVGYILASKNRTNENKDSAGFLTDETTVFSESSCKLKASAFTSDSPIKQEPTEDENSKPPVLEPFAIFDEGSTYSYEKKYRRKSSKHHSKHKKSKSSKEKKRRSSEIKERKRRIDARCTLTAEHLDKDKTRVLTAMGGLFYAGYLSPLQPPDVYAVTLDGERGNRPHIMSREEVLRDAIIEVCPATVEEIPPGTRLCAYWSQQYRCLYPGTSADPGTPDVVNDKKFVSVEFDDGDSGRIALEDIRFLLSDYPIVEYDPNPLLSLGKRKRRISQTHPEITQKTEIITSTSSNYFDGDDDKSKLKCGIDKEERRKLKKMKKDKIKKFDPEASESPGSERKHKKKHKCNEENCKHRKHKKRRKHKKHHHRENVSNADSSLDADYPQDGDGDEDFTIDQGDSVSQSGEADEEQNTIKRESEPATFDPNVKEDTMTEEEVASSITESSGSVYDPGCKKERLNSTLVDNHSKIAAFLPARQLWAWAGKGHKRPAKGRTKKQFYRTIQRGKETITVGDSAVFLSTGRPDRPYIGRIECMWETSSSNKVVRVRWFYHPEETVGCPNLKFPGALFESPHEDENDVQTISHKCEVLPLDAYTKKFGQDPKQYQNIYDNNDTYYLAGYYDPTAQTLKLQAEIPTLAEDDKWA